MQFWKYHGLGNDYVVLQYERELTSAEIQQICHRNYGIGSDGILVATTAKKGSDFAVRIFNPDGSEAKKSGNGLRIFARYLFDTQQVKEQPFTIWTAGGGVTAQILRQGSAVIVNMGRAEVSHSDITLRLQEQAIIGRTASIGNPHFVVLSEEISAEATRQLGPQIESHHHFPKRTDVQFAKVLDRNRVQIEIWERGAGYTLASGSSSCAAAAVAHQLALVDSDVQVVMPGGTLSVTLQDNGHALLRGAVVKVAEGRLSSELFSPVGSNGEITL